MKELQEETEGIVVFADLLGGSPSNQQWLHQWISIMLRLS